jgi:glycerol dehydrogenase
MYHGEKVAFGTICQLVMENRPMEEIDEVVQFCKELGLPTTLKDLGIKDAGKPNLMKVAEKSIQEGGLIHGEPFPVTAEMVVDAMLTADAIGR